MLNNHSFSNHSKLEGTEQTIVTNNQNSDAWQLDCISDSSVCFNCPQLPICPSISILLAALHSVATISPAVPPPQQLTFSVFFLLLLAQVLGKGGPWDACSEYNRVVKGGGYILLGRRQQDEASRVGRVAV